MRRDIAPETSLPPSPHITDRDTRREGGGGRDQGAGVKLGTAVRLAVTAKLQGAVPVHGLAQPWKTEVPLGAAVSVTSEP
jgi:hypothetical protein